MLGGLIGGLIDEEAGNLFSLSDFGCRFLAGCRSLFMCGCVGSGWGMNA
jgi:hypothetical protein